MEKFVRRSINRTDGDERSVVCTLRRISDTNIHSGSGHVHGHKRVVNYSTKNKPRRFGNLLSWVWEKTVRGLSWKGMNVESDLKAEADSSCSDLGEGLPRLAVFGST